jgi:hypothetical protein
MKKFYHFIIISLLSISCTSEDHRGSKEINKNFELNNREKINLSEAVSGEWNRLFIFHPYTTEKMISETLGFKWDEKTSIHSHDGISLLVFTKDRKIVKYIEHPRNQGDFSNLYLKEGYERSEAKFVIDPEKNEDWPYLIHIRNRNLTE